MIKRRTAILIVLGILVAAAAGGTAFYRWKFPYGYSHCCSVQISLALLTYANDHAGRFPDGESSPEASLSLLYRLHYLPEPDFLRGMTVPADTVSRILKNGGLLGPETCGWHYVPGLSTTSDPRIAILWCKTALGHNGLRTWDHGREVLFVDGHCEGVSGADWPAFMRTQETLRRAVPAAPPKGPS
jgi:hypothetical protein